MTPLLERALVEVRRLSPADQDAIASIIFEEIEDEELWDQTFAGYTPSPHHPFGAKGVGESATVGAPPAIVNAVAQARSRSRAAGHSGRYRSHDRTPPFARTALPQGPSRS